MNARGQRGHRQERRVDAEAAGPVGQVAEHRFDLGAAAGEEVAAGDEVSGEPLAVTAPSVAFSWGSGTGWAAADAIAPASATSLTARSPPPSSCSSSGCG